MAIPRPSKLALACLVLTAIALIGCTRSASTPPVTPATGGTPGAQDWQEATLEAVRAFMQTQTEMARQGIGGGEGMTPVASTGWTPVAPVGTPQATSGTPIVITTTTPLPTAVRPTTYTLQGGEYPYCIARRFNVDPGELMAINGLAGGTPTYPGQVLRIPQTGSPFPAQRALRSHPATYTVQSGDTIYSVGCLFGDVDPMAIASVNQLSAPYTLTPGRTINIP